MNRWIARIVAVTVASAAISQFAPSVSHAAWDYGLQKQCPSGQQVVLTIKHPYGTLMDATKSLNTHMSTWGVHVVFSGGGTDYYYSESRYLAWAFDHYATDRYVTTTARCSAAW